MEFYRLLNKIFNNQGFAQEVCKRFNNAGWCVEFTSNILEAGEFIDFSVEKEIIKDNKKIANIIRKRKPGLQAFRSLSVGDPDYLPFSFLQRALRCGAAVCLIRCKYQLEDLIKRIENFSTKAFPSILDVISDELSLDDRFWEPYDTVSEAIKDEHFQNQKKDKSENTVWVPIGTGFLVGRNYLLTNHHVLPDKEEAKSCIVQFKYEQDDLERDIQPIEYHIDTSFFKTSPESKLDYTIVKLHPFSFDKLTEEEKKQKREKFNVAFEEAGDNFGWLPMLKDDTLISPPINLEKTTDLEILNDLSEELKAITIRFGGLLGEPVNIIQHPRGRRKEIVISDNKVQSIYQNFIQYTADADFGSSGSPVFNVKWQLVALHHAVLVERKDDVKDSSEGNVIVRGNLGVRIHQIIEDLESLHHQDTQDFLNEFVNQPVRRNRKIFILAGRKRQRFQGNDREEEAKLTKYIGEKVKELLNNPEDVKSLLNELRSNCKSQTLPEEFNYNFQPQLVPPENRTSLEEAIKWINQETNNQVKKENYQLGDVAIEIATNYYYRNDNDPKAPTPDEVGGATIYYVNLPSFKDERKTHAETTLISLLSNVRGLPSRGAQPDTAVRTDGLKFCREVTIPSLVLYVGYWTNTKERELLDAQKDEIAKGIVKGIVQWSNSLALLSK